MEHFVGSVNSTHVPGIQVSTSVWSSLLDLLWECGKDWSRSALEYTYLGKHPSKLAPSISICVPLCQVGQRVTGRVYALIDLAWCGICNELGLYLGRRWRLPYEWLLEFRKQYIILYTLVCTNSDPELVGNNSSCTHNPKITPSSSSPRHNRWQKSKRTTMFTKIALLVVLATLAACSAFVPATQLVSFGLEMG